MRRIVIERDYYKCSKCKIAQRSEGYREESGEFVHCDDLMADWAANKGLKVFTVFLTMHQISGDVDSVNPADYAMFCQKCRPRRKGANPKP